MNIILIGYRGTGKSSVGRVLAKKLGRALVETDGRIVEKAGMFIPEIVDKHGWEYFRDLESQVVEELKDKNNLIVDTGGGIILREVNISHLKKNGNIFWLKASVPVIVDRIKDSTNRPSLTSRSFIEEVEDVLAERLPKYKSAAQFIIETRDKGVEEVSEEILKIIENDEYQRENAK
ncbi:MAG: shikimate kinase [Thermodesulfobacteriota bacterium]|nr:shikimate kinase [Thermodesulfobacteriota bacterium]